MNKGIQRATNFNLAEVMEFAPITMDMNREDPFDIIEQFSFHQENKNDAYFYQFTAKESKEIMETTELVYGLLVDSLDILFSDKYKSKIPYFFGSDFINANPEFVDYAKYTYQNNHEAIYGRFDVAYDFNKRKVTGFYEFNGDTPVMLFESIILQNYLLNKIKKDKAEAITQSNSYHSNLKQSLNKIIKKNSWVGFFCDFDAIEDTLTTELLSNFFSEDHNHNCLIADLKYLKYDILFSHTPFQTDDHELDYVFILNPWEEMVESSPEIIDEWWKWADKTRFLEPAWRWFVSNKGVWAWVTYLLEEAQHEDERVKILIDNYRGAENYLLKTYMDSPRGMKNYAKKPIMGRLSSNIEIYIDCTLKSKSEGCYDNTPFIYQEYCSPRGIDGRNNAILGTWLAPYHHGDALVMEASTLAIREFDSDVLSIQNERFMPHVIIS